MGNAFVLAFLLLALLSGPTHAQEEFMQNCFDCVIGIWDDPALASNIGTIEPNIPKDIYIGIKFAGNYDRLAGMEFSIAGMRFEEDGITLLSVTEIIPVGIQLGVFQAPADTSRTSIETGGINLAWTLPVVGDNALLKLQILTFEPTTDKILRVKRRYPTTNPVYHTAIFNIPDPPIWSAVRASVGCYIMNWSGDPMISCNVVTSVEESTWSGVKQLFR